MNTQLTTRIVYAPKNLEQPEGEWKWFVSFCLGDIVVYSRCYETLRAARAMQKQLKLKRS